MLELQQVFLYNFDLLGEFEERAEQFRLGRDVSQSGHEWMDSGDGSGELVGAFADRLDGLFTFHLRTVSH